MQRKLGKNILMTTALACGFSSVSAEEIPSPLLRNRTLVETTHINAMHQTQLGHTRLSGEVGGGITADHSSSRSSNFADMPNFIHGEIQTRTPINASESLGISVNGGTQFFTSLGAGVAHGEATFNAEFGMFELNAGARIQTEIGNRSAEERAKSPVSRVVPVANVALNIANSATTRLTLNAGIFTSRMKTQVDNNHNFVLNPHFGPSIGLSGTQRILDHFYLSAWTIGSRSIGNTGTSVHTGLKLTAGINSRSNNTRARFGKTMHRVDHHDRSVRQSTRDK